MLHNNITSPSFYKLCSVVCGVCDFDILFNIFFKVVSLLHIDSGELRPWAEWSSCDVTCGQGTEVRQRSCSVTHAQCQEVLCADEAMEEVRNCTGIPACQS